MNSAFSIGTTPVYIFERHSDAIIPWAQARRSLQGPPPLVTFDKHTDTLPPFLRWSYRKAEPNREFERRNDFMLERLSHVDFSSDSSIVSAAKDLWHDEHIRAAMGAGIVREAFVIAFDSVSIEHRVEGIHYLPSLCHHGCTKMPHDNDCDRKHADLAIDDAHLGPLLDECDAFQGLMDSDDPIILDIDLDYFRTVRALSPGSCDSFRSLIPRARCITIATEPMYVEDGRLDEEINSDWVLKAFLAILNPEGEQAGSSDGEGALN